MDGLYKSYGLPVHPDQNALDLVLLLKNGKKGEKFAVEAKNISDLELFPMSVHARGCE